MTLRIETIKEAQEEMLMQILEFLRSEEASQHPTASYPEDWADIIEKKFKGDGE